jgi:tRNA (guanine-N7-)-methyltransferase
VIGSAAIRGARAHRSGPAEAGPPLRRRSVYADRLLGFSDLVLLDGAEFINRGRWRDHFATRIGTAFDGRVILEIGCNDAALLATVASKHSTTAFVGIDWKCRALHTAAERVAAKGLRNVTLLHGRGQDVSRIFGNEELDELWVFHPDPCDKPRELANRLLGERFLRDAQRVLRRGASVVLKTDHRAYYEATLDLLPSVADAFDVVGDSSDFWNDERVLHASQSKCFCGESTAYESRFRRKRKPIYFLELRKR